MEEPNQRCNLCQKKHELCYSHIIPEFLYKPLYDEKGRLFAMSTREETRREFEIEQKGLREHLLCENCETQLSDYEGYARDQFDSDRFRVEGNPAVEVSGLDSDKLRLFFLSILWRSSISTLEFFREVELGPHQETAREMILKENPKPFWRYGCILADIAEYDENQRDVIIQPVSSKEDARHHYFYVLGGFLWHYVVSSHRLEDSIERLFIDHSGTMTIPSKNPDNIPFLNQLRTELHDEGKLQALINQYDEEDS